MISFALTVFLTIAIYQRFGITRGIHFINKRNENGKIFIALLSGRKDDAEQRGLQVIQGLRGSLGLKGDSGDINPAVTDPIE